MFEPRLYTHDEAVRQALRWSAALVEKTVVDSFVASLSRRRLELRSALGSYAVARNLREHRALGGAHCDECGAPLRSCVEDVNILNFERLKWGGVRHAEVPYVAFDLERAHVEPAAKPTDEDATMLRSILNCAAAMPAEARPGDLLKGLRGVVPGNAAENRVLVEILGYCGVLQPAGRSGFFRDFTPWPRRDPPTWKNDWHYPASWWRGSDGVNEEAARYWFGRYLLA